MSYQYKRTYRGQIQLIILDLAGTTIDYGSCAPAGAFVELFSRHHVELSDAEARGPMGMHKRDHIQALLSEPAIGERWKKAQGGNWDANTVEQLYKEFIPLQTEVLPRFKELVPGTLNAVKQLREENIKIAATTGYNRDMMEIVLAGACDQGFKPDAAFCGSDVSEGRPAPWMALRCAERLRIHPLESIVHVGDTVVDVEAGLNGGMWSIGVVRTGNMLGLSQEGDAALEDNEREVRLAKGRAKILAAGAHFVADSVLDALPLLAEINGHLAAGEKP